MNASVLCRLQLSWKLFFTLCLVTVALNQESRGATSVTCDVDVGTWTPAGSPYLVSCDVHVGSLDIQPGVTVQFEGNYALIVEGGRLRAEGAHFTTTNRSVGWQGIWFLDAAPGSFFANCIIEYSKNSGCRITNSAPSGGGVPAFTNCAIINNSSPDFGGGIDATLRSGELVLQGCLVASNACNIHGGGINATITKGTLKMVHCTIVSNMANVAYAPGSYAGGGIRISGNSVFLNCLIGDNVCSSYANDNFQERTSYGGGICSDSGDSTLRNCRLQRNVAQSSRCCSFSTSRAFGGAIYFELGHLTMQNCIVDTNTCSSINDSSGAGIMVGTGSGGSGSADVINCTLVANNTQGAYGWGGTVRCLNSILYFNNSSAEQVAGIVEATYCDIQGGYPGDGNKAIGPGLRSGTLELNAASQCIDAGNPEPRYNDQCFTPPTSLASKLTEQNDMGAYGGPAACCWSRPCGPPEITSQPGPLTACVGSSASFCVSAVGDEPLRYQWRFHGTNASNTATNVSGATNTCLIFSNVQTNQAGYYSVTVANNFGGVESIRAPLVVTPVCVDINLYAGLTITAGVTGQVYRVQYVTNITDTSWTTLREVTQTVSGVFILDPQPANLQRRFYQVVP